MKHELCQIRVELRGVRPLVWRLMLVPSAMKLTQLHRVLQCAMGWENRHSYTFEAEGNVLLASSWASASVEKAFTSIGGPLIYLYDPGDDWEHQITLEERVSCDVETDYATCIAGERACPPEDCGGAPSYEEMLKLLQKPKSKRYAELREWIGPTFDPLAFSTDEVNRKLVTLAYRH